MSIFTTPVTFTVNAVARIFNHRYNRTEGKTVVGEYFEPAATLAENPTITVKQDTAPKTKDRSLVAIKMNALVADGITYKPMLCNFTTVFDKEHTAAQRDEIMELMAAVVGSEEFRTGISNRLV